jgi:ATP synthase protein I
VASDGSHQRPDRPPQMSSAALWRLSGMGFELFSEIIAGVLVGLGLDWLFGTSPVFLIIGSIAGVTVGMVSFIRQASRTTPPKGERKPGGRT